MIRVFLAFAVLAGQSSGPAASELVIIDFLVHTPATTQPATQLFLSGNHPALGNWKADGLALGRDYFYFEDSGAVHNEAAWAAGFDKMLLFFFAK